AVTVGDHEKFRRNVRLVVIAVLVIGAVGAVLSATDGPWVVQVFFGAKVRLPGSLLGLLGISTILLMGAQVLQPALIAAGRHRTVTLGWSIGTVVLVALLFLPLPPMTAAVVAQLAGSLLVVVVMAIGMITALRSFAVPPVPAR
ncbi:MAG: hypothetical protein ACRDRL_14695, partial [Sciscionella sp.]